MIKIKNKTKSRPTGWWAGLGTLVSSKHCKISEQEKCYGVKTKHFKIWEALSGIVINNSIPSGGKGKGKSCMVDIGIIRKLAVDFLIPV